MTTMDAHQPLHLLRDRRGSIGLELAMMIPLLMLLLVGFYEAYMYIRTVAQLERASASVGSMMSRQTRTLSECSQATSSLNLGTYVEATTRLMTPLPFARSGEVIFSSVGRGAGGNPQVLWQRRSTFTVAGAASALGKQGDTATLPTDLANVVIADPNINILVAEVFYRFTPFSMTSTWWPQGAGAVTISRLAYLRARTFNQGVLSPASATPGCPALPTPPA